MAATQYQVMCRYYNDKTNKCIDNKCTDTWVGIEDYSELSSFYTRNSAEYNRIVQSLTREKDARKINELSIDEREVYDKCSKYKEYQNLANRGKLCAETAAIATRWVTKEPEDYIAKADRDMNYTKTMAAQENLNNPKYSMIFMYDGLYSIRKAACTNDDDCKHKDSYIYADRMKRFPYDVWFEHSIHASLASAMNTATKLMEIYGKDNVIFHKVVDLEQYIEIV